MPVPEVLKSPVNLLLVLLVVGVLLFFLFEIVFTIKIGRGACKIVGYTIATGLQYTGILSGVGLIAFFAVCDRLNW